MAYVVGVPSVTKTITIHKPGREPETLTADIRVRNTDEQEALQEKQQKAFKDRQEKEAKARKEGKELKAEKIDSNAHVREDLLAMGGLIDDKGKEVAATPEMIDTLWKDPFVYVALIRAWGEVQRGVQESIAKN